MTPVLHAQTPIGDPEDDDWEEDDDEDEDDDDEDDEDPIQVAFDTFPRSDLRRNAGTGCA